jgi:inorganic pyrophosphatase
VPRVVTAYIEITPFDTVKYEVDKATGYLHVDRPQASNALPPTLYGFVPQTWCGPRVARLAGVERGDGDPLDICVFSERAIDRADILLRARPIGGLLMVDKGEADDKIVAVLQDDPAWGEARTLEDLPPALIARLRHYFMTYKLTPGAQPVAITQSYGPERAAQVLAAAIEDYIEKYGPGSRKD